jgi:hypothetical protein
VAIGLSHGVIYFTLFSIISARSIDSMMEAKNATKKVDQIPTFTLLGKVFKSILNGRVEIDPTPDKQRLIAGAQGYKIPYGSFPGEANNLNLAKSRMERTVKVTLSPVKGMTPFQYDDILSSY